MAVSRKATEAGASPPRPGMPLTRLVRPSEAQRVGDWASVWVHGIETDSRRVRPGDLFVALAGLHTDGSRFIDDAVRRGACAIVTARADAVPPAVAAAVCPSPRMLLPRLAARLYGHPERRVRLVGVTGTNGKTTTTLLASHLLRTGGARVAHWTTTEVDTLQERFRPVWTTPLPEHLMRFLRRAADGKADWAALEVSSHALSLGRIEGLTFRSVAVTNISPDHLDFHPSFAAYAAAKRHLLSYVAREGAAFLSADDPEVRTWALGAACTAFCFGLDAAADLGATEVQARADGLTFVLTLRHEALRAKAGGVDAIPVHLPLLGLHNVQNALAAAGMALWAGVPLEVVATGLATFAPVPRRMERQIVGPFTVINDVAMNEASYATVLDAVVNGLTGPGRLTVVHALRGGRGPAVNARVMQTLATWNGRYRFAPLIVTLSRHALEPYGELYQVTPVEETAALEAAASAVPPLPLEVYDELEDAVAAASDRLQPGDTLLLLGTFGMDDGPALARQALARRLGLPPPVTGGYLRPGVGP